MSINITIAKNQINRVPRRTVLSDLEQLKICERNRRKRLRLEQVRQQSKERSNKVLERAKIIERHELEKLQSDKEAEERALQSQKLQGMQQKYQEDMENIGQAHIAAAKQPDVDQILKINHERNRIAALERGRQATKKLEQSKKQKERERNASANRMRNTRETENARAAMISQLAKMSSNGDEKTTSGLSENDENFALPSQKNVRRVTAMVHQVDNESSSQKPTSCGKSKRLETSKHVSEAARNAMSCESDDQEPRRTVPIINLSVSKADKIASYNPDDYRQPTSEESTSISSTNSQDSSQSTITQEPVASAKSSKLHTTPVSNQVHMYDLSNRRENQYTMPSRAVERVNIYNEPHAEDQAREVRQTESYISQLNEIRKAASENRGKDALLREKVRRDYNQLLKTLDHYCKEERKLKASQVPKSPLRDTHAYPSRKRERLRKRQQKLERDVESVMGTKRSNLATERVITLPKVTQQEASPPPPPAPTTTTANQSLHYEQILEMLMKLEKTKYKLWMEYGSSLPESISNVTQRPLWQEQLGALIADEQQKEKSAEQTKRSAVAQSPEIRVINVSMENEARKKKKKEKDKAAPQLTEIAVQTSIDETRMQRDDAQDKSVQVEISKDRAQIARDLEDNEQRRHALEPAIKIVAQTENVNSGSSVSQETDIVFDIDERQVKVTPKKSRGPRLSFVTRRLNRPKAARASRKSSVMSRSRSRSKASPVKRTADKTTSPRTDSDIEKKTSVESSCNSTEISHVYSRDVTPKEGAPYTIRTHQTRRVYKIRQTSDSSTSYASPPVIRKGGTLAAINSSTPVLEILDSSRSATEKIRKSQISPVSSPETPSPRTMKLASNIPRDITQRRALFTRDTRSRENVIRNDAEHSAWIERTRTNEPLTSEECKCTNPSCRLYHNKPLYDDDDEYRSKVSKKYEELQKKSMGKIESIKELINKLRKLDPVNLTDASSSNSRSVNYQIAQDILAEIEKVQEAYQRNLLESKSSIDPVASTPQDSNVTRDDDLRGDALDLPFLNKPKVISNERIMTEQSDFTQLTNQDDTIARLSSEILKQTENRDNPMIIHSDDSSGKQVEMLSSLNAQLQHSEDFPLASTLNGKSQFGRKILPISKELSTIKEFDTPDTTGKTPSARLQPLSSRKPTPRTSTPMKAPPENKSTQVASKSPQNSDFSGPSSSNAPSSDNNKATSSDLSGFTGLSEISKVDSQNSMKQLYEKVPWAGATVKKTRESAALDSSSTSEPNVQFAAGPLHPIKRVEHMSHEFSGITDVSSISLRNANKSTEQSVLQKARTSTPNIQTSSSISTDCSDMTTSPSMELT